MKRLLRILLTLFLVLAMVPGMTVTAHAATVASGKCSDEVTWSLSDDGTLAFSGSGTVSSVPYWTNQISLSNAERVKRIELRQGITAVEKTAFYMFENCTTLIIPASVSGISSDLFRQGSLQRYIVSSDNPTLCNDSAGALYNKDMSVLIAVPYDGPSMYTVPEGVSVIGSSAFNGSRKLTRVTLPDSLGQIGTYAFFNCTSLTEITIPENVWGIYYEAFGNCSALKTIRFTGNAPDILQYDVFYNVTATAFYPQDNPSWMEDVRQDYEGAITWVAFNPRERMWGATRQTTAVAISRAAFPHGSDNVILASGDNYPDALAGGPLAYELDAPILLIRGSRPDQATLDEIRRLGAKHAYILGGAGVVSDGVADTLRSMDLTVERLAGANRFDTAVAVAEQLEALRGAKPTTVFFVYSHNYPDALAVSNVASLMGAPILYVDNTGNLRDSTAAYLKHLGSVEKAYIISGPGVIGPNADTAIGAFGPVQRIYGADRYETCTRINRTFADVLDGNSLCLACGTNYPDALAGSVFAAKYHAPMVLVRGGLTAEQTAYVKEKAPENVYAFGGAGVLPDSVLDAVKQAAM